MSRRKEWQKSGREEQKKKRRRKDGRTGKQEIEGIGNHTDGRTEEQ